MIPFLTACTSPSVPNSTPGTQLVPGTPVAATPAEPTTAGCDCSVFPPKQGCDSQCGITTGIVEQVTADSVTISVPSIKATATGQRTAAITQHTFAISPAEAKQLQTLQGSRVALTFHQQNGQNVMKSIRPISPLK
jgi:hypothetical protein